MGKSSINVPFSVAMLVITRGYFQDFNEGGSAFLATFPETIPVMWLSPQLRDLQPGSQGAPWSIQCRPPLAGDTFSHWNGTKKEAEFYRGSSRVEETWGQVDPTPSCTWNLHEFTHQRLHFEVPKRFCADSILLMWSSIFTSGRASRRKGRAGEHAICKMSTTFHNFQFPALQFIAVHFI